ncbi:MAG: glycosyltransferase [Flavobacteriales bacterium]|nr:glycosyltransferase [Flavobacteriales bacterium]
MNSERPITAGRSGADRTAQVQVVIPCFNDGLFLAEAITSLGEAYAKGAGVVIVNDGSTDARTLEELGRLRAIGFQVIDGPNRGLAAARNIGWRAATGPYVLFLDADNRIDIALIERAIAVFSSDPLATVVYSDKLEFGDREGVVAQPLVNLATLLSGNRIDACAVVRRDALEALGGFDEAMRDGYEDWELWIRMMQAGYRFVHLEGALFHYRVRSGSLLGRAADPIVRVAILAHITAKHRDLFARHAGEVVTELHRIQAHDHVLLRTAEGVLRDAQRTALRSAEQADGLSVELDEARAQHKDAVDRLDDLRRGIQEERERSEAEKARMLGEVELLRAAALRDADRIDALERSRESLSIEAHRLVGEVDKAMGALDAQREHGRALQALIAQYEARIRAMESSTLWRLRAQYHKLRALLRTSSDTSSRGWKWLKRITFLVSSKGRHLLRKFLAKVFKALYLLTEERPVRIILGDEQQQLFAVQGDPYHQWMAHHFARPSDLRDHAEQVRDFSYRPLVSIVMPVYNTPVELLEAAIRSVRAQVYPDWELCIADDRSTNAATRRSLERWQREDPRIKVVFRTSNGHISAASNSAIELATGAFAALMDHDDLLAPDALFHIVKRLQRERDLDLLYTDEDKIDEQGRHSDAHFKPQWCPDHLLSRNYFGHLVVVRTALLRDVAGFRLGFEGSQDYDLLLRLTERTTRIAHIPRVLYHWRIHAASAAHSEAVKPYAYEAARRALTEACERRNEPAQVSYLDGFRGYSIRFTRPLEGRVCVIIPTKDKADILGTCLRSVFARTDHPDFEVIVVSNNSREEALFELLNDFRTKHPDRFRWYAYDVPFNFAGLMNFAATKATGSHLLYLNNDTEVIHADWLSAMHEWSQRPSIGAVGVKLLYPNDTIQHAGVVIGLGGVAGHTFVGYHKDGPGYFNYINTINNNSAVTAACMMVQRSKVEAIGGWDEAFSVEYNDVDLCLRLREKGFNNVYLPHVSLYHFESLTRGHPHLTKESYTRHLHEVGLFQERWARYVEDDPCYNPNLGRGVHDWQFAL